MVATVVYDRDRKLSRMMKKEELVGGRTWSLCPCCLRLECTYLVGLLTGNSAINKVLKPIAQHRGDLPECISPICRETLNNIFSHAL